MFGVDIGGTGIKGAPVDLDKGDLSDERYKVLTPHPATPDAVLDGVHDVVSHFGWSGPLGVTFPDPELAWNEERGHHDFGQPDWEEFWSVVKGNGPCNAQRLAHRTKAWDEGAWVREASLQWAARNERDTSQARVEQAPRPSLRGRDGRAETDRADPGHE